MLVCRTEYELTDNMKEKISLFCNVRKESVVQNLTSDTIYAVPLALEKEGLAMEVCKHLKLKKCEPNNKEWEVLIENIRRGNGVALFVDAVFDDEQKRVRLHVVFFQKVHILDIIV